MLTVTIFSAIFASRLLMAASSHAGEWSEWSACSTSCDAGFRVRNRTCESCDTTVQTQACNEKPCQASTDNQTQIILVVVVTAAVISILTAVLVVIFFVKGTHDSRKPRASSLDTSKRLRTMTNVTAGNCVENKVFQLQRMAESRGSLQTSRTTLSTLKDFGEQQLRVNSQM